MFLSNFFGADFTPLFRFSFVDDDGGAAAFSFNGKRPALFTIIVIKVAALMKKRFALRFADSLVIMSAMVF
jgi:hypothetical protein